MINFKILEWRKNPVSDKRERPLEIYVVNEWRKKVMGPEMDTDCSYIINIVEAYWDVSVA